MKRRTKATVTISTKAVGSS